MDAVRKNLLEESFDRIINVGFCIVPYEDLSEIIDINPVVFGTTKDEKIFSIQEVNALFKSQFEQMGNMKPTLERNRIATRISPDGNHAFIVEEITLTLSSPEETNTIFMRASCVMEYVENHWKLTHWHTSTPVDTENDHWHQEEWKREKEKLQKLVDQQTANLHGKNRELKIEAALERIRAQVTAMQESSDLLDIVVTMRTEFVNLGHEAHYFWHMRWLPERYDKAMTSGDGTKIGMVMTLPRHIHGDIELVAEWEKSDEPTYVLAMDVDTAVDYVDKMISLGDFEQVDPQAPTLDDIRHIGGLTFIMARTTHGEIGYSLPGAVTDPSKDAIDTLVRFAGVFDLAYKRFEDLKAAERQHREAQIELALERVRARTMAMQSSDEFADVAAVLFDQIRTLGGNLWGTGFGLCEEDENSDEFWFANENGVFPPVSIPNTTDPAHKKMYEGWKSKMEFLALEGSGEELKSHYDYMMTLPEVRPFFQKILDEGLSFPEWQQWNAAYFSHGYLLIITLEPYPDKEILKRFARVFDQTYTRFLDLKKAEAQALEAQIEAALERVRSRSLAMHHTDDLQKVIHSVHQELIGLKLSVSGGSFIAVNNEIDNEIHCWGSGGTADTVNKVHIPRIDKPIYTNLLVGLKNGPGFFTEEFTQKEKKEFFSFLFEHEPWSGLSEKEKNETLSSPGGYTRSCNVSKHTSIVIVNHFGKKFSEAENAILKRFGKVFEQSYTRFLDLQKAETRAREAKIEVALERVRAKTMAMQTSAELADTAAILFKQLSTLGIAPNRLYIIIFNEETGELEAWGTEEDGKKISQTFKASIDQTPVFQEMFDGWKEHNKSLIIDLKGKKLTAYIRFLSEQLQIPVTTGHTQIRRVQSVAYFAQGLIGMASPEPQPNEIISILERFAMVFDQTYTRFLDLKKAEAQARESEIQLALERVRARSMAMHQSDELADLSLELVKQVHALGIDTWFCAFNIYDDHPEGSIEWGSNGQGTFPRYRTPREGVFLDYYEAGKRGETLLINEIGEDECPTHYDYLCSLPGVGEQLLQMKDAGIPFPAYQIDHAAFFRYGYILFITFEPVPKAHEIFKRFAKVFQQTYTRFLDLQKAEEQAREARIEAALERVRSRSMGMHKSDELIDVVREIGKGIHELDIQLHYSQIFTDYTYDPKTDVNIWVDVEGQDYLEKFHLPYIDHTITLNFYNALNEGLDYFSDRYSKAEKDSYFKLLFKYSDLKRIPKKRKELILNASGWTRFTVILNEAALNFGRFSLDEFTDEEHKIFIRFAKVFGQAYTRFLDLKKAEEQAREAQIEAAFERVRSRSLAMQKTNELQDVVRVVAEELKNTGVILDTGGAVICTYFQDSRDVIHWTATDDPAHPSVPYLLPYFEDELFDEAWESKSRGDDYFAKVFSYDVKNAFFSHAFEHSDYRQLPDEYKKVILESKSHGIAWAWAENSAIMIPSIQGDLPSEEEKKNLIRFAKVFEQSFIRFLDLQKAEAQAREAQIEASLEKVRAQSMGMQSSEDLSKVASVMFDQMKSLGGELFAFGIVLCNKDKDTVEQWHNLGNEGMIKPFNVPVDLDYIHQYRYDQWKAGEELFSIEIPEEYIARHFDLMFGLPSVKAAMDEVAGQGVDVEIPDWEIDYGASFTYGYLLVSSRKPFEETRIFPRFAKVFDQAYTRFLDLQKAEAQAREAKIEAALEKVRSRTMGMQSSDELPEVANMLFLEVQALGIPAWSSGFNILAEDKKSAAAWMSSEGTLQDPFTLRLYGEASFDEMGDFLRRNEPFMVQELGGEALQEHYKYMKTFPDLKPTFKKLEEQGLSLPTYQINHLCKFSHGFLLFITYEPVPDAHDIFKRFTNVFDQTYTRFLDLKKAEKQARESRIEAALERVRSRAMAMQTSDELKDVALELRTQMGLLGQKDLEVCAIHLYDLHQDHFESWGAMHPPDSEDEILQSMALFPKSEGLIIEEMMDYYASDQSDYVLVNEGEKFKQWFELMKEHAPEIYRHLSKAKADTPAHKLKAFWAMSEFSGGALIMVTYSYPDEDSRNLLRRTANVFGLAYKRFNDLKRAEEQALEAQIENALEKVRSRSLAMQTPDELVEVAQLLREEMGALGVEELETSSIYIHDDTSGLTQCWFTIKNADDPEKSVTDQMTIDLKDTWVGRQMHQFYGSGQESTSILMKGDHRIEWIRYCEEKSNLFGTSEFYGDTIPERTYHLYKFSNGFLGAASPGDISEESWDLMKRATGVFSFAYTRFSDLQKAEESARRARQQASLDRVRADISSMRSAEDLNKVTPLIWNELTTLGIPFIRCGIFIIQEEDKHIEVYLSKPDGTSLAVMHLPFDSSELVTQTLNAWQQDSVYTQHWTREEFLEWGRSMMEQGKVQDMKSYQGAEEAPESLHLHFIPFNQGMLYVGSINPLEEEEISLSESLAKAFSIAYARYEDFVKLEKAKASIENALAELKATQSQLVQQEKLASLGQLTAGIAHEIKNPLNFVNNFSELSVELIEEAREELSVFSRQLSAENKLNSKKSPLEGGGHLSTDKSPGDVRQVEEALAILDDIETNLKTIHKHGSRADSIVKSMLEHSRGGSGKMELTDLNSLLKEFVNLTFHGMRAGKDPINVDIEFDLDESIGEVPLIAEDFSRVIINLCNNGFDAMREKLSAVSDQPSASYKPKLTVLTNTENGKVIIEIEDNGPGIPDDMKDKILQPFFTTKKGTAGTGLGLSITNDIVKAHGGKMHIKSLPGKGSTFTINLEKQGQDGF